jgi:queuine tRNA-ribosyltransferase
VKTIETQHGPLTLPAFLPDATRAVTRAVGPDDMVAAGVKGIVVNALHLSNHPGTTLLARLGGVHRFMNWQRPVVSDSGGFQIFSLIAQNPKSGSITNSGFNYHLDKTGKKRKMTPEKCIQRQFRIGADIMFCLDECTHPEDNRKRQEQSVKRTIAWANRCRQEFDARVEQMSGEGTRPLLFAVVQGGGDTDLRQECAGALMEIGFDGYGFGGWPIGTSGKLVDAVAEVASLVPADAPRFALGIGKPENLVAAYRAGYDIFDCSIPSRDARRKRLYVFLEQPEKSALDSSDFYEYLYILDKKHATDDEPLGETCDCACCRQFSRAYLHHLFTINDMLAYRLATIHNLRFYSRLVEALPARGSS